MANSTGPCGPIRLAAPVAVSIRYRLAPSVPYSPPGTMAAMAAAGAGSSRRAAMTFWLSSLNRSAPVLGDGLFSLLMLDPPSHAPAGRIGPSPRDEDEGNSPSPC